MNNTAILIYPRVSDHASRILKQADYLINNGVVSNVIILSMFHDKKLPVFQQINEYIIIKRIKLLTYGLPKTALGDPIKFMEFFLRCIIISIRQKAKLIIPHSMSVLPIGVVIKMLLGAKLIYDAHELETEAYNLKGSRQKLSKIVEKFFIRFVDKVIVVSDAIAAWYKETYGLLNIYVVKNIPDNPHPEQPIKKHDMFRQEYEIPSDAIIFIYQGLIEEGRGIKDLLEVFKNIPLSEKRHIVFMGYGNAVEMVKEAILLYPNIHYKSAVKRNDVIKYTSSADVGLFYITEDWCLSNRLAEPNKLYEYAMAGLYLCVNDNFPIMQEIIIKNNLGIAVATDKLQFSNFIKSITKTEINRNYELSKNYRSNLGWHQNNSTLNEIFLY